LCKSVVELVHSSEIGIGFYLIKMNCSLNLSDREFSKESPTRLMIPCINPETLTYKDFFEKYLLTNHPVMFSSGLTAEWNSVKHWVTPEGNINFPSLKNAYGNISINFMDHL